MLESGPGCDLSIKNEINTEESCFKSMTSPGSEPEQPVSKLIADMIKETGGWRGSTYKKVQGLIRLADPEIVEELKWKKPSKPEGTPVYSHSGLICVVDILKNSVRLTFFKGASLKDPSRLFNGGLDSNTRRFIDIHQGDKIDEAALKRLIRGAVAVNLSSKSGRAK